MKRGTPRHPKFQDLKELLQEKNPTVVGYLELLWHFAAEFAPQGDIGRFSDKRIESALGWSGKSGKLVESLTTTGWVDSDPVHRLLVHDWKDHADGAVKKRLIRSGLSFLEPTPKVTGQRIPSLSYVSDLPIPALPTPDPTPNVRAVKPIIEALTEKDKPAAVTYCPTDGFDPESAFEELWKRYPAKGRVKRVLAQQFYVEEVQTKTAHHHVMQRMAKVWEASEKWKKGFILALPEWIHNRCWDEDPPPPPDADNPHEVYYPDLPNYAHE